MLFLQKRTLFLELKASSSVLLDCVLAFKGDIDLIEIIQHRAKNAASSVHYIPWL